MTVGQRIKAKRIDMGLSAEALADACKVSRSTIFRYENGDIEKLPAEKLEPIANILHTSVAYLMGWEDSDDYNLIDHLADSEIKMLYIYRSIPESKQSLFLDFLQEFADRQ